MSPDQKTPGIQTDTRYLARITIYYGIDPEELLSDYSINISAGGVFIETNGIIPQGTVLTVKFNLPDSDVIIYTHAIVAWVNDPDNIKKSSLPPGIGVQFIPSETHQAISDFLEKSNLVPTW